MLDRAHVLRRTRCETSAPIEAALVRRSCRALPSAETVGVCKNQLLDDLNGLKRALPRGKTSIFASPFPDPFQDSRNRAKNGEKKEPPRTPQAFLPFPLFPTFYPGLAPLGQVTGSQSPMGTTPWRFASDSG